MDHNIAVAARQVERDGWARMPGACNSTSIQRLQQEIQALANPGALDDRCLYFYDRQPDSGMRLTRIERFWESLPSLTGDLGLLLQRIAGTCLGENACLFKDKINFRWPGSPGYAAHQDTAAGWVEYAHRFISIGVFLHPSSWETGGFEIASGQHRKGLFENIKGQMNAETFESLRPEPLRFDPGDLLILHGETPHRTVSNPSNECVAHFIVTFNPLSEGDQRFKYYNSKVQSFSDSAISSNCFVFRVFEFTGK